MSATASGPTVVPQTSIPEKKQKTKPQPKSKAHRETKPTKILPTDRIGIDKQLDILRAYAAGSSQGSKSVSLEELARIMKMAPATLSLTNAFFNNTGFITRTESGYMPSAEVLSFLRAYEWNRDTAAFKLAPIVENSWFYTAVKSNLEFGSMEEEVAITILGENSSAGPDYRKSLKTLVEYMVAVGLVQRDGTQLRPARQAAVPASTDPPPPRIETSKAGTDSETKSRIVSTAFSKTAEGAVHFNVSVRVEMAEFAGWQPDRISAFFSGIAEVLKAKAGIEEEVSS